jgi:hypothetical protein
MFVLKNDPSISYDIVTSAAHEQRQTLILDLTVE